MVDRVPETEIVEAATGRQALEALARQTFDLVLIDWNMPEMDGLTFTRTVRAQGDCLPIVMVSSESHRIDEALAAGISAFVAKPATPASLGAALDRVLPRS